MRAIVAASCVAACVSGEARSVSEALRDLLNDTKAEVVCALNAGPDRTEQNALVWTGPNKTLAALVFRTDMKSTATPKEPCWASPGHCALFEGDVPLSADACSKNAVGVGREEIFQQMLLPNVYRLIRPDAHPPLEEFATLAKTLWLNVLPDENVVALLDEQHAAYLAENDLGSRRVRIVPHQGNEIGIAKLRVQLDSLDMAVLRKAAIALDVQEFDLAGPDGAVTGVDGSEPWAFIRGECLPLVSADDMHNRLDAANREFPVERVPSDESAIRSAFKDMAQRMLGGEVVHGPPIQFVTVQDPKIFMLRSGVARTCR